LDTEKKVTVIGGGIAGLTTAWELASSGIHVDLVEKTSFLGGHAIQYCCKATEECRQCGACTVEAMLKNVVEEPGIHLHLNSVPVAVEKKSDFSIQLKKGPVYIDPKKCTNCGECYNTCGEEGIVLQGYSKNNSPMYAVDASKCMEAREKDECKSCEKSCPEGAINLKVEAKDETIRSDAVVLATGFTPFDPEIKPTYGYGKNANVVTGLDLEKTIREKGMVARPSDGKIPEKLAFIQCVGSRDDRLGNLWCSKVCCPYALRMAELIKKKNPETDITIFYMDIQNIGKDFPIFYEQLKSDLHFVRTIPVDMIPDQEGGLKTRYMNEVDGIPVNEIFDMVVLSIGIMPGSDNESLADFFNLELDGDGFISDHKGFDRCLTSSDGVFVAGTVESPKDIAASKAQAGNAASDVLQYVRGSK
jgi:heterodisulfide reductase subunit A2